jgi:hypothetical protein
VNVLFLFEKRLQRRYENENEVGFLAVKPVDAADSPRRFYFRLGHVYMW